MKPGPILTGQQIGLLSGPLYTPYKVLGAVRTALDEGRTAVYWLETNDADFQEISSIHFIDKTGQLKRLCWQKETQGLSCGNILVDKQLIGILITFFNEVIPSEYTAALRELTLEAYQEGRELGAASLELARALFPFDNLRFFDPREEEFRAFSRKILMPLFEQTPVGTQCPGFIDDQGVRRAIFRSEGGYALRDDFPVNIADFPLLPNVSTRPVCQDAFFNTAATIAGPGEMAYLAPLADLYQQCAVNQPRLIPRMSLTLIEPWSKRQLSKLGFEAELLLEMGLDSASQALLTRLGGIDHKAIEKASADIGQKFVEDLKGLHPDFTEIWPIVSKQIKQVLGNIRKQNKERNADKLVRLQKVFDRLLPYGKPQERILSPFYFMNLYGGTKMIRYLFEQYNPKQKFLELS